MKRFTLVEKGMPGVLGAMEFHVDPAAGDIIDIGPREGDYRVLHRALSEYGTEVVLEKIVDPAKGSLAEILARHGWEIECVSPFEIRHEDGSFASGQAADIVVHALTYHPEDYEG